MGKSLSVIKSHRQDERRHQRNLYYKDAVTKHRKQIRRMIERGEPHQSIMEVYRIFSSFVDKAAKKHIFHKNAAARKKSRINSMIHRYHTLSKGS